VLQHVAVCCSVWQCVAVEKSVCAKEHSAKEPQIIVLFCGKRTLKIRHYMHLNYPVALVMYDSVCCSVLQCVAVCCSVCAICLIHMCDISHVCCGVLQCVAVCCSVLQCVAV